MDEREPGGVDVDRAVALLVRLEAWYQAGRAFQGTVHAIGGDRHAGLFRRADQQPDDAGGIWSGCRGAATDLIAWRDAARRRVARRGVDTCVPRQVRRQAL